MIKITLFILPNVCFSSLLIRLHAIGTLRAILSSVMPHSHHSHSGQFCKHASGLLQEVVEEAIRKGFTVFGMTEHVPRYRQADLYPEEVCHFLGAYEAI